MEKITDKIAALADDTPFFSLEFFPPKTAAGLSNLQARLARMSQALRPLFVNITWGAGGSTSSKSLELAEFTQQQLGLTTCLHLTCTNMSQRLIDEALSRAKTLGIRNILALRGDPPRNAEYGDPNEGAQQQFVWAVDLVKYIREQYGDYFCIGVAAYPDGHADTSHPERQDAEFDLPYLVEKTKAGADFIMTQLFFDVEAYRKFEAMLRGDESGVFKGIPIIPGLMPIQSYQVVRRVAKLSHAKVPAELMTRLDAVKSDDEEVKKVGVDILSEIIEGLKKMGTPGKQGFHFYTLNLEKAVSQIVERNHLIKELTVEDLPSEVIVSPSSTLTPPELGSFDRRRLSSGPQNRVVVEKLTALSNQDYEITQKDAGKRDDKPLAPKTALEISEGEGSLGREATWDDFPNGRWGDARSPAFGEIDGYGVSLHVSIPEAIKLWGFPVTTNDINTIFQKHVSGELRAIPWSEEGLNPETSTIKEHLLALNAKGWWTVASQPAVNGVKSSDPVFGWGPRSGFVFQKPFVEFFISNTSWKAFREVLDKHPEVTYFASNSAGAFEASDSEAVNPVTWGTFAGKEIITPTIIEAESFRAWRDEAFSIWREWQHIYPPRSPTAQLLKDIESDYWLLNIVHHNYLEANAIWDLLLNETK
ncbi:methylenetetrahydrofolate reductase 2 [Microthyrium microscopicum]|uniref:Methylenetetrahydrofolate reductase 2 n=1 Tax=Microthyrium microscopicum TaxID=703497 RepID=A0A6A6UMQ9_9PEZI|nr:methylenetetrahydrofolate reductase 2 [Microthyrium microscopicum]